MDGTEHIMSSQGAREPRLQALTRAPLFHQISCTKHKFKGKLIKEVKMATAEL